MIDTLTIYTPEFRLLPDNKFRRQVTTEISSEKITGEKVFCNEVKGVNLTVKEDFETRAPLLYVQSSLPKLLFGTSLYELKETDGARALEALSERLRESGVHSTGLANFELSRLDYCRNLTVERLPADYLLVLKNFELSRRNKQQFKGETLTFYNKSAELSFYNKVKEVRDKEDSPDIVSLLKDRKEDILRVESRLLKKKVIERELGELSLAEVFDFALCKENLLRNFNRLSKTEVQLEFNFESNRELAQQLRREHTRGVFDKFLRQVGLKQFLASMDFDWQLVRSFVVVECGVSRRRSYEVIADLKRDYERFALKANEREVLAELREKITA